MAKRFLAAAFLCLLIGCDEPAAPPSLRFETTVADGLTDKPQDGRLLILIGRREDGEPRYAIDPENVHCPTVLGHMCRPWRLARRWSSMEVRTFFLTSACRSCPREITGSRRC